MHINNIELMKQLLKFKSNYLYVNVFIIIKLTNFGSLKHGNFINTSLTEGDSSQIHFLRITECKKPNRIKYHQQEFNIPNVSSSNEHILRTSTCLKIFESYVIKVLEL